MLVLIKVLLDLLQSKLIRAYFILEPVVVFAEERVRKLTYIETSVLSMLRLVAERTVWLEHEVNLTVRICIRHGWHLRKCWKSLVRSVRVDVSVSVERNAQYVLLIDIDLRVLHTQLVRSFNLGYLS